MSVRFEDGSFQYSIGIAENILVEVGKFTFPVDFVIFEMKEDRKVPLILGRPFQRNHQCRNRFSSPLSESLPKEEELYTRSPARITYSLKRLECTTKGTHDGKKKRDSFYQHQEAGKQEKNQMGLLTMDDGIVNWGEHTEVEETNHALMAISSSNESRFTKTNDFKGVPHPLSGDYTPRPQEEIDDSFEGSCGNTSEHSFETESESLSEPNEMSKSRLEVTNEKVVSELQEVEPSCAKHVKTPRQPLKDKETQKVNRKNWNDMMERELGEGYSFTKKKCFVCGSLSHLIKDCDYYEKKMAREAEVKRVVNTGNGVAKPVWTNANRINHSNKFVPRSVQLNAGRPNFNSVRPNINTGRTNINSVRPKVNVVSPKVNTVRSRQPVPNKTSNSSSPKRPQMNQMNQRRDFSKSYSSVRRPFEKTTAQMSHSNAVMGSWGSAVKTSASYNWRNSRPNFHYNSGPTFNRTEHPLKNMVDRGIFDSGCSGHMTGNKDSTLEVLMKSMEDLVKLEVAKATYLIENQLSHRVKIIRSDNGTEFKNRDMLEFCGNKGIKQEMYLTASRPDIMYAVCVCSRFQVTPKTSHLNAVKRIFKYLKGKPNLGLWYPRESPFDLEAFSDSDYGGSNLDRKSTTGGCQFLGQRLISWQCKKQTIVATSTTEAEYVAAANCCGQVLWVQNQLLDYGFNFMNTKIHIDNESTICIVKNPVYHSKTKHIEIRHHFIRDCYEKKLISVEKIHTDLNVADLLTKPFDGPRFNYLVVSIGFAEIVDFLRGSNLRYALTSNPTIYDSLVKQFWQTATANTKADGSLEINATIDTIGYTITEASIRDSLQLEDATGITMLPNDELFEGMGQMGYPTDGTFTFWKSFFTPQWRYLVHHLLHCISSKSGGWDQFGSNIATALICLSTNRVYNFSKLIFDGMVANLRSKTKFLMYPRFLQMILNIQTENKHLYLAVSLTKKIFGNMKRGFRGAPRPLLPTMLLVATNPNAGQEHDAVAPSQPSSSSPPVPSTSSPPVITTPTPIPASIPSPTPIPETQPEPFEHTFEEPSPVHQHFSPPQEQAQGQMAMDDLLHVVPKLISRIDSLETDLKQTKLTMGNAIVKLVKKVKKLEGLLKKRHVVLSDSEEEEPEAQGRKSQDDPLDSSVQGLVTPSTTKVNASGEEQVEDISPNTLEAAKTLSKVASLKPRSIDKGRRYKRRKEAKGKKVVSSLDFQEEVDTGAEQVNTAKGFNTGSIKLSTVSEQLSTGSEQVSTVGAKKSTSSPDKGQREGKAPMISEETPKKSKEQILQEEASLAEAIRLDSLQKEEEAKQIHLDSLLAQRIAEEEELNEQQKKRKAQVQFEAQHYTNEDWDLIRAKIEANAELSKSMLGSELQGEDFAKKMVDLVNQRKKYFAEERARAKRNKPMTQSQLKTYMMNYLKNQGTWKLSQLKNLSFEEVKEEFDKLVKQTKTPKRLKDDEAKDAEPTDKCTDKSKITRKQSKSSKHGHENQKSTKAGSKARKVKPQCPQLDQTATNEAQMIEEMIGQD
ncbi:putative ribonuclease H-like domain-containing protein [Tanacetum coccineum]|uniref:Ribonuclease H-like domain-containing protein n=1 Tax=Tanacetum coccineum TaxID=301880 RepID=A0ABQ5GBK5_9ASTR